MSRRENDSLEGKITTANKIPMNNILHYEVEEKAEVTRRENDSLKRKITAANKIPMNEILHFEVKKDVTPIRCPFPERHANMDAHPSAAYYRRSNSICCFVCRESWTPVRLLCAKSGCSREIAATYLLRRYGRRRTVSQQAKALLSRIKDAELKDRQLFFNALARLYEKEGLPSVTSMIEEAWGTQKDNPEVDLYPLVEQTAASLASFLREHETGESEQTLSTKERKLKL